DFHVTGVQTCALPICLAADGEWQASQQTRVAGHVTGVFTRLVGTAGDYIFVGFEGEWVTFHQGFNHLTEQVIGANLGQTACMARSEERRVGRESATSW